MHVYQLRSAKAWQQQIAAYQLAPRPVRDICLSLNALSTFMTPVIMTLLHS
ncbi:hypothetical protein DES39_1870 [Orbus hercynius]|uniref:Uncharacterized protein n=1 Tax=Orbus hercynius TaxID=593135 RepID=A0A495RB87_9GAMM|nr:hypothetical protein DES39_1870 [Orbus hercynius]